MKNQKMCQKLVNQIKQLKMQFVKKSDQKSNIETTNSEFLPLYNILSIGSYILSEFLWIKINLSSPGNGPSAPLQ